jgi:hypothetical protein
MAPLTISRCSRLAGCGKLAFRPGSVVGYAGYFVPGNWEVHWICEYRCAGRWIPLDGQLGPIARDGFKIRFPVEDVPVTAWRSAPSIWRAIRAGTIDENICGVSFVGIHGRWFVGGAPRRRSTHRHRGLPGDYWDRHGTSWRTREVTEDEAK